MEGHLPPLAALTLYAPFFLLMAEREKRVTPGASDGLTRLAAAGAAAFFPLFFLPLPFFGGIVLVPGRVLRRRAQARCVQSRASKIVRDHYCDLDTVKLFFIKMAQMSLN